MKGREGRFVFERRGSVGEVSLFSWD